MLSLMTLATMFACPGAPSTRPKVWSRAAGARAPAQPMVGREPVPSRYSKVLRFGDGAETRFFRADSGELWLKPPREGKALDAVDVAARRPRTGLNLRE